MINSDASPIFPPAQAHQYQSTMRSKVGFSFTTPLARSLSRSRGGQPYCLLACLRCSALGEDLPSKLLGGDRACEVGLKLKLIVDSHTVQGAFLCTS